MHDEGSRATMQAICWINYIHVLCFQWFSCIIIIVQVPDSAILDCPSTTDFTGKDFMNPADDKTVYYEPDKQ